MSFAGLVDFGTVVAILSLQDMVSFFLRNIGSAWGSLIDSFVLADRVFEILDQPVVPERYRKDDIEMNISSLKEDYGIVMNNVVFSYNESEKVLNGVNITVDRGKTAALVGESGAGKSTIVKLLLGFYPADGGTISILGKQLSDYTLDELRKNIAYVPQDAYLFTTSIKENIRYGRLDASDDEIIEAAKNAYAHEFIMAFPNGYETMVGERGESLSGGQRQRIAIARAFIRNAPIFLLDEATSALDSESEQLVQKGIETLMGERTTLVVAHRPSTIEKADMIYVVGSGKAHQS
ncbi:MAG: ATP-binding cassette domain-containing protein [Lachnospiraceae bacterium]|nr:ATP-binding cassette domain-containing protein [Lachnospiraceae bacterium]